MTRPLVAEDTDVIVVGAGSAGCTAAIAAGRSGCQTVLIDRLPFPGGTSTAVLDTFYAFYTAGDAPKRIVGGIAWEVVEALREQAACFTRPNSFGSGLGITYRQEALKQVWDRLLGEAGVRVLTGACLVDAREDADRAVAVLAAKGGLRVLVGRVMVDASGDGDAALYAGAKPLADNDLVQPATLTFQMANVDISRAFPASGRRPLRACIEEAGEEGYQLPGASGSMHPTPVAGVVHVAMTRVPSPIPDDPDSWRHAEVTARAQVGECVRFLRDKVPGFADAEVVTTSACLGVRETRRVAGRHVLTEDEVLGAVMPGDAIVLCGAPVEDLSVLPTRWAHIPSPGYYGIGLDCLRPAGLRSVLLAGRCFSAAHGAHSSARSMATCMAMGHAAGAAAALAVRGGGSAAAVSARDLRDVLAAQGAILEGPS